MSTTPLDATIAVGHSTSYYRVEHRDNEWRVVIDHAPSLDKHRSYLLMRASSRLLWEEEKRLQQMTDAEVLRHVDELKAHDLLRQAYAH